MKPSRKREEGQRGAASRPADRDVMLGQAVGRLSGASCDHPSGVGLRRARRGPLNRKESNAAHPGLQPRPAWSPQCWALPGAAFVSGVNGKAAVLGGVPAPGPLPSFL